MLRIRHCLECPSCKIRYLISLSPFKNGSYVVTAAYGSREEYILHCSCGRIGSRWTPAEVRTCHVSRAAYERGYGAKEEIVSVGDEPQDAWRFGISAEGDEWKSGDRKDAH